MRSVVRSVVSVIVGVVVASIVMMLVETVNGKFFYPDLAKSAQGVTDREVLRKILATAPTGAFMVVIGGWILGSIAGGSATAWIAKQAKSRHTVVLGMLLTLAGVANNFMIPPPPWFWVVSLLVLLPSAYLGGRLVTPKTNT